ncbi:hypothetical protein [Streptomyces sp. NBC_01176]|uniref:hypothetical protein n=1 Tax=Streptomyces sp. NBC_01176 TaxID=2903760 RepID=UPI00386C6D28
MRSILALRDSGEVPCAHVTDVIQRHLTGIEARMAACCCPVTLRDRSPRSVPEPRNDVRPHLPGEALCVRRDGAVVAARRCRRRGHLLGHRRGSRPGTRRCGRAGRRARRRRALGRRSPTRWTRGPSRREWPRDRAGPGRPASSSRRICAARSARHSCQGSASPCRWPVPVSRCWPRCANCTTRHHPWARARTARPSVAPHGRAPDPRGGPR